MIYDRILEIVFSLSFAAGFIAAILLFGQLADTVEQKKGFNSPKYLGALLLGFLAGVIAEAVLSFLSETGSTSGLSWFWPLLGMEIAIGTIVISAILYFLFKGAREGQDSAS